MMTSTCNSAKTTPGPFQKYHEALTIFNQSAPDTAAPEKMKDSSDDKYSKMKWTKTPVDDKYGSGYYEKYHSAPLFALLVFKIMAIFNLWGAPAQAGSQKVNDACGDMYRKMKWTKTPVDDKYGSGYYEKYHSAPLFAMLVFKVHSALSRAVPALLALFGSSSFCFACVYVLLGLMYITFGGQPSSTTGSEKLLNLMSISMEVFGLLILRHKIQHRNSVAGISGMTMLMYTACYAVRIWLNMPKSWSFNFMELELEASFGIFSLLLVLDCLRSIFVTHRSTYQAEFDVLHVKYLIPTCFFLSGVLRAHFDGWSPLFSYMWTSCLYMDVLALMPQVVMMAQGGGKVPAPIAHFVAATFISRIYDLSDSLLFQSFQSDECFSYYIVIFFQVVHILIIADFMYYYVKALTSGQGLEKDMEVNVMNV